MKSFRDFYFEQEITSKNTAIKRNKLATPILHWIKMGYFKNVKLVVDFGAGRGDNVKLLQEKLGNQVEVIAYEPHPHNTDVIKIFSELKSKLNGRKPDVVFSTYVLNVVDQNVQEEILKDIKNLGAKKILIATRNDIIPEMKKMKKFKDLKEDELKQKAIEGYVSGTDKFQRLVEEISGFTLEKTDSKFKSFVKGVKITK